MSSVNTTPTTVNISAQKVDVIAELQALVDGINGMLTGIDPFILTGQTLARAALLAEVQKLITAMSTTKATRKLLAQNVADERAQGLIVKPLRKAMKSFLIARYGENSPQLQQFGYPPNRKRTTKASVKAAAAVKGKATKAATGTKGKQQKAAALAAADAPPPAEPATAPAAPAKTTGA